jgi:rhodanese-related sulfurtransferase
VGQTAVTPPTRTTVDTLLDRARRGLERLHPCDAKAAMADGALLIDIRSAPQRLTDGVVPGALTVERNVLEWRCDPSCAAHDPRIGGLDARLVVMCDEGYQSSLAAASLQQLGFRHATDLIGGFRAWRAAGLPVNPVVQENLMRAIECPCGHHLEGVDDGQLFRLARDHVDRAHPEMQRTDEQLRERVAADAYDVPVAGQTLRPA